jgi:phospholipid N-methyltransferase
MWADYLHFFWAGLLRNSETGSLIPSQRFLIDAMIAPIPKNYAGQILELGAGTAPLTLRLAEKCPNARVHACEINPSLARYARQNLAGAGVNGNVQVHTMSAQDFLARLDERTTEKSGFVISGLPLGNLERNEVLSLLQASSRALGPDGMFIQAQHFPVDRKHVRSVFGDVRTVPVLRNVPPLFVYYATNRGAKTASCRNDALRS